jgi:hypothetical protein
MKKIAMGMAGSRIKRDGFSFIFSRKKKTLKKYCKNKILSLFAILSDLMYKK